MKAANLEIQKSIYSLLTGDATLMGMITGIFDDVIQGQPYPYVTIGDVTSVPWRTHSRPGEESTVTLHIWSQYKGNKEPLEILNELNRLLGYVDMTVTGHSVIKSEFDGYETLRDPDGLTRHVPVRYRIRTLED